MFSYISALTVRHRVLENASQAQAKPAVFQYPTRKWTSSQRISSRKSPFFARTLARELPAPHRAEAGVGRAIPVVVLLPLYGHGLLLRYRASHPSAVHRVGWTEVIFVGQTYGRAVLVTHQERNGLKSSHYL